MAYQFNLRGIPVTCDTLDELVDAVQRGLADARPAASVMHPISAGTPIGHDPQQRYTGKQRPDKPQGSGPQRAWAEAQEYAAAHDVTVGEARSIIAKKKREARAAAMEQTAASLKGKKP